MNTVTVKIKVTNQLTGVVTMDNTPGVEIPNYKFDVMQANANAYADMMPNCQVSMEASNGDFVCIPSRNMMRDEVVMPFDEFMAKWYDRKRAAENEELQWEYMNGEYPEDF